MDNFGREENVLERMSTQESALSQVPERYLNLIKRTVAVGASNEELELFLYTASQYNLDPLMKEIIFFKAGGKPVMIVTRDGYLKTAMSDPNYDGLMSFVVRENDEFSVDAENFSVTHRFGQKDRGKIIGAWAKASHKRRQPVICFVSFGEYRQQKPVWQQYPSAMIQKVAESFALRRQFGIAGTVGADEVDFSEGQSKRDLMVAKAKAIDELNKEVKKAPESSETYVEAEFTQKDAVVIDQNEEHPEEAVKKLEKEVEQAKEETATEEVSSGLMSLNELDFSNLETLKTQVETPEKLLDMAKIALKNGDIDTAKFSKIRQIAGKI